MNRDELKALLVKSEVVRFGEFTLKSGKTSDIYFDLRIIPSLPKIFPLIVSAMVQQLKIWSSLVGVPLGGLPFATAMAIIQECPLLYVRDKEKSYGTKKRVEGLFRLGQKMVVVEDVMTTGQSVLDTVAVLHECGMEVKQVVVIVDRRDAENKKRMDDLGLLVSPLFHEEDFYGCRDLAQSGDSES